MTRASLPTYEAIVDDATWQRVQALVASNTRTKAVLLAATAPTPGHVARTSRYPLAGLVVCGTCGKKLQGDMVRGHAFYRCKATTDYPWPSTTTRQPVGARGPVAPPHGRVAVAGFRARQIAVTASRS